MEVTPHDHPDRVERLGNAVGYLSYRYERLGNVQDLEAAIARSQAAIEATPEDHSHGSRLLSNLGKHLVDRYQRTGNPHDLEALRDSGAGENPGTDWKKHWVIFSTGRTPDKRSCVPKPDFLLGKIHRSMSESAPGFSEDNAPDLLQ